MNDFRKIIESNTHVREPFLLMDDGCERSYFELNWQLINDKLVALGELNVIIIITLFSMLLSVFIVYVLVYFFADHHFPVWFVLKIAAVTPIFIAPVIAWPLVRSHFKLATIEQSYYLSATYDMLTGILTRQAFFNTLDRVNELANMSKMPYSILSIDVDDFKRVNDSYGHAAGDHVLKLLGNLINGLVKNSGVVGRVGGDEIVLLLPNTSLSDALLVGEQIRVAVANAVVSFNQHELNFTLSIGVSQSCSDSLCKVDEILAASDKALYKAKKEGKNRVVACGK